MTDICKCNDTQCTLKDKCYRYTSIADEHYQSWFAEPVRQGSECEYFVANGAMAPPHNN